MGGRQSERRAQASAELLVAALGGTFSTIGEPVCMSGVALIALHREGTIMPGGLATAQARPEPA